MQIEKYLEYLRVNGASDIEHSGEDFLSHLKGTMNILIKWERKKYLSIAGLFHSVYGTECFKDVLIPSKLRPTIQVMIGKEAEKIAFFFGIMVRSHFLAQLHKKDSKSIQNRFDKEIIKISESEYNDLCHLYIANRLEQHPRWPKEYQYEEYKEMKQMKDYLCHQAWSDLAKEYKFEQ